MRFDCYGGACDHRRESRPPKVPLVTLPAVPQLAGEVPAEAGPEVPCSLLLDAGLAKRLPRLLSRSGRGSSEYFYSRLQ